MDEASFSKKPGRRSKSVSFSRPPLAEEFFTEENKKLWDERPGYVRHFIKQYLTTGNLGLAARQANISKEVGVIDEAKGEEREVRELLPQMGLDGASLVAHLKDCLEAQTLIRDKHGNIHEGCDKNLKLKALELIFKLTGQLNPPREKRAENLTELFENTPIK